MKEGVGEGQRLLPLPNDHSLQNERYLRRQSDITGIKASLSTNERVVEGITENACLDYGLLQPESSGITITCIVFYQESRSFWVGWNFFLRDVKDFDEQDSLEAL